MCQRACLALPLGARVLPLWLAHGGAIVSRRDGRWPQEEGLDFERRNCGPAARCRSWASFWQMLLSPVLRGMTAVRLAKNSNKQNSKAFSLLRSSAARQLVW